MKETLDKWNFYIYKMLQDKNRLDKKNKIMKETKIYESYMKNLNNI